MPTNEPTNTADKENLLGLLRLLAKKVVRQLPRNIHDATETKSSAAK